MLRSNMSQSNRHVRLSRNQPGVPPLLKHSSTKDEVAPDAPPMSSDDEGPALSTVGNLTNLLSDKGRRGERKSNSPSRENGSRPGTNLITSSSTGPKTRSRKRLSDEVEDDQIEDEGISRSGPPSKRKAMGRDIGQRQMGTQHAQSIFRTKVQVDGFRKPKTFTRKKHRQPSLSEPEDFSDDVGPFSSGRSATKFVIPPAHRIKSPEHTRTNFRIPGIGKSQQSSPSGESDTKPTGDRPPIRAAKGGLGRGKRNAQRKRKESPTPELETEQSQPHVFRMPELPAGIYFGNEPDLALEEADITLPILSSPLKNGDSILESVCPMCDDELDESSMEELRARRNGMTMRQREQFCRSHKKKSARKEWGERGYPDIDWTMMDKRIKNHYDFLRTILNGGKSYYANVLSNKVKSGQNKTRLMSEANLTPGYYGMRGLRLMSEHLVNVFSSELRKRAVQDRLVSARGHMYYIQSVLVPELAVRLIMEDMNREGTEKVTEEQARTIMEDSTRVGELLNEEVADHVLYEDEEDEEEEENQHVEMELREEDEAHITYEHDIQSKEDGEDKPNYGDQNHTDQEDEGVKYVDNSVIHIDDSDKVKSEDQNGARQEGKDIKSGGNGFNYMKHSDDDSLLSDHSDSEFEDI